MADGRGNEQRAPSSGARQSPRPRARRPRNGLPGHRPVSAPVRCRGFNRPDSSPWPVPEPILADDGRVVEGPSHRVDGEVGDEDISVGDLGIGIVVSSAPGSSPPTKCSKKRDLGGAGDDAVGRDDRRLVGEARHHRVEVAGGRGLHVPLPDRLAGGGVGECGGSQAGDRGCRQGCCSKARRRISLSMPAAKSSRRPPPSTPGSGVAALAWCGYTCRHAGVWSVLSHGACRRDRRRALDAPDPARADARLHPLQRHPSRRAAHFADVACAPDTGSPDPAADVRKAVSGPCAGRKRKAAA